MYRRVCVCLRHINIQRFISPSFQGEAFASHKLTCSLVKIDLTASHHKPPVAQLATPETMTDSRHIEI